MELSQEQREASYTDSKTALCLAGAGSGKTRVLISRIKHLLEGDVSPSEIVAFTFTRKAGKEMKERLEKSIGGKVHSITIGTLHSVALSFIQRFGEFIRLNPGKITVYSSWEERVLLKDVCEELGYHNGKNFKSVKKREIDAAFHLFYTRKKRNEREYIPNEIMDSFFMRCRENNALTYGMIMTSFLDLIPKISNMLNFRHVLIDEVQDLDPLQWRISRLLCSLCKSSLFVVGDDSQSIYSFRGADPDYIIRNQNKFDIFKLKDNYRSDAHIVDSANKMVKYNENRLDLEMNAIKPHENELQYFENMNSRKIFVYIKEALSHYEGNIAVLGRNHILLEKLSNIFEITGIDHKYIGKKTSLTRSPEFRIVHAFLVVAFNPFDNFSFLLCKEYFEINIPDYQAIRLKAVQENKSHFQIWSESEKIDSRFKRFVEIAKSGDFKELLKWIKGVDFDFDITPIFEFIGEYLREKHQPMVSEYLEWLALFDVQDEMSEEPNKLQLMTIHASKGLEFDMVIIVGMNEGILPGFRSKNSESELESERRLAYVAYTRAKEHLILTSRPVKKEDKIKCFPSRFIKESYERHNRI